jgi:hypothetical protein
MRLYLDEHIPVVLAPFLRAHGVDCLTVRDAGYLGISDEEQLTIAAAERRVLVSFNCRDFIALAHAWQRQDRSHAGIILSKALPLPELFRRFRHFVAHHRDQDLTDQVLWLIPTPKT